jgi:hypothetical protein
MLYTDFQRKVLEENMTKIEKFGKKLEPNLKKLYDYMLKNNMDSFIVADFDKGSKYLDNFRVNAEILDIGDNEKGLRVAYRQEEIADHYHSIDNGLIVAYTKEKGVNILYVDEHLYEYTLGLKQLCATALNTVHASSAASGNGSFQEECQQILIDLLEVNE